MFLWWGKDLVQFYNDAYRPSLGNEGKHPLALGQKGAECWVEIWPVIKPLIDQVLEGKGASWSEDQLIPIYRNGRLEDVYWTFSYSPVRDDEGEIAGVFVVCHETTAKMNSINELRESEMNFRNLVMQAPVGICIVKGEPVYTEMVNDSFLGLVGRQRSEFEGKPLWQAVPEAEENYAPVLEDVIRNGKTYVGRENRIKLIRAGKPQNVYINFVCEPIKDAAGTVKSVMILAIEITDQVMARRKTEESEALLQVRVNQRTAELSRANKTLAKMNRELEHFTFAASHDMQEPLRKVSTFSNFLLERYPDQLDETARTYLVKIDHSVRRMKNMIEDLLNYSQQTSEEQEHVPIDLNEILEVIETDLELVIQQKMARITKERLPRFQANPTQMNQLFFNLYSNALKFSKPGVPVRIDIKCCPVEKTELARFNLPDTDRSYIRISFIDNGIGFEQKYAEQIFSLFKRLHGRSEYEGTGIGLGLCKKIVESHRGAISASSEPGRGAAFHILLPVK
jgi:PAS domain S-box-containing protein